MNYVHIYNNRLSKFFHACKLVSYELIQMCIVSFPSVIIKTIYTFTQSFHLSYYTSMVDFHFFYLSFFIPCVSEKFFINVPLQIVSILLSGFFRCQYHISEITILCYLCAKKKTNCECF